MRRKAKGDIIVPNSYLYSDLPLVILIPLVEQKKEKNL